MFVTTLLSCQVLERIANAKLQAIVFSFSKVYGQCPVVARVMRPQVTEFL